ncbi:MAG: DUF4339 domain-containing protein [Bacteroidota bacterium]|nr:DUF4339 domain-containing protein [Bacteroidota bacterium]MDQ6889949.1 DUF4339 domain-containing protein [Bacteroidota bacterium]
MTHYFLKDGKKEVGPLTINQLKCRQVNKSTPVWFAGLDEWTTVEEVYELKELFIENCSRSHLYKTKFFKIWNRFFKQKFNKKVYQVVLTKERDN